MLKNEIKKIAEELYDKGAENQNLYDNMGYDVSQAVNKILEAIEKDRNMEQ